MRKSINRIVRTLPFYAVSPSLNSDPSATHYSCHPANTSYDDPE